MTTQAQIDDLKTKQQAEASAQQAVTDAVNALTPDPDVNPLQAQLDAATARITVLQAVIDTVKAAVA